MKVIEFYDRALTGTKLEEREFDLKVLPGKLRELIKKHEVRYKPEELVPQDLDMAKRAFDAGVELLMGVGVYCRNTNSVIRLEEEEVKNALADTPFNRTIGEGTEAVQCYCRGIGDKRRPRVIGGLAGAPVSEERFIDIMISCAKEPIDELHTGAIQSLFGRAIKANTPIELMLCHYEALWAREAIKKAGKPGLGLMGVMSGVTSEAQDAANFAGGFRPCDTHLVGFSNELKVCWEDLKKIIHNQRLGNIIKAGSTPMLGGYCGGPEGTVITALAEVIQGYVMARPISFSLSATSLRFGWSNRQTIWVNSMIALALSTAKAAIIPEFYVLATAGPCTEMLCEELAAQTIALTASGASALIGAPGHEGARMDYVTGMESRILCEVSRAAAGINLSDVNEVVRDLVGKYEEALMNRKAPVGKTFTECYEPGLTPSKEYVNLWRNKKKELEKMGLIFH